MRGREVRREKIEGDTRIDWMGDRLHGRKKGERDRQREREIIYYYR